MTAYDPARFVPFDEAELRRIVSPDARVEKLAGGFGFIEGPVWSSAGGGSLIFSDIPRNELKRWTPGGGPGEGAQGSVVTYRTPSGNANGNTRDREGRLISCEHSGRRVSIESREGRVETLVDAYQGRRLNSPNDVVVKSDGSVWFTDPPYGLREHPEDQEQEHNHVFRFDPRSGTLRSVVDDFHRPNGLCFSPDERRLYIADSGDPHHVRVFDVGEDGALTGGQVFCTVTPGIPDGMRCDTEGRLYSSAGDGIHIYTAGGDLIGKIITPDAPGRYDPSRIGPEVPANLCFGGPDGTTLHITACTSLYSIPLLTRGAVLH
jgi:gluconolactonase